MAKRSLNIEVNALDAGNGYTIKARSYIEPEDPNDPTVREERNEHRDTEAEVQTRLGQIWNWYAGQVDAE